MIAADRNLRGSVRAHGLNVAVVANSSWYLFNFRASLIRSLLDAGHRVVTIANDDAHSSRLARLASEHCGIPFSGAGTNPLKELYTVVALRRCLKAHDVDVVLSYTPKGNIYSALALTGMAAGLVVNVSGLGRSFAQGGPLKSAVQLLYRRTFSRASWVFFQNHDDHLFFLDRAMVEPGRSSRLPGSGVDLTRFAPVADATVSGDRSTRFMLVARMLWDKGIGEYVEAARIVRRSRPDTVFRLLGGIDPPGRAAVPRSMIDQWQSEGLIDYLGTTDDVASCLRDIDCVVLPSTYREGVPRSLLEAAAMARPIITTDSVGCRDTVDNGVSGYLCHPKDPADLADCMLRFLALPHQARLLMGQHGRSKMEREFDENIVLDSYIRLLDAIARTV